MSQSTLHALQKMVDEITDIDFIIQHIQQYYPEGIVGDDSNEVKLNLRKINRIKQQQLGKYIGHVGDHERPIFL